MDQSPFARLPPELRNTIYEYALLSQVPLAAAWCAHDRTFRPPLPQASESQDGNLSALLARMWTDNTHKPPLTSNSASHRNVSAFTKTCQQIRKESLELFYTTNSFILRFEADNHAHYRDALHIFLQRHRTRECSRADFSHGRPWPIAA